MIVYNKKIMSEIDWVENIMCIINREQSKEPEQLVKLSAEICKRIGIPVNVFVVLLPLMMMMFRLGERFNEYKCMFIEQKELDKLNENDPVDELLKDLKIKIKKGGKEK